MTEVKTLHIGVASREFIKRRTKEIASGKRPIAAGEPKLYVTSLEALAKILSEKNMLLLDMIRASQPQSMTELAKLSGRAKSNLSRTLHGMERLGLIEFHNRNGGKKVPMSLYNEVRVSCVFSDRKDAPKAA